MAAAELLAIAAFMNGWETLEALRELAPDIPVILASGYDKARVMAGDHPERPQAFLGKPYRMADLKAALDTVMEESACFRSVSTVAGGRVSSRPRLLSHPHATIEAST